MNFRCRTAEYIDAVICEWILSSFWVDLHQLSLAFHSLSSVSLFYSVYFSIHRVVHHSLTRPWIAFWIGDKAKGAIEREKDQW